MSLKQMDGLKSENIFPHPNQLPEHHEFEQMDGLKTSFPIPTNPETPLRGNRV